MENLKNEKKEGILEKILVKISKKIVKNSCSCCSEKKYCRKKCNTDLKTGENNG
ncbi:hypothetical protein [Methanococcus sp. CF]